MHRICSDGSQELLRRNVDLELRQGRQIQPFEPPAHTRMAQAHGFSLHAGIAIGGAELEKLERLCRYISRPAFATERPTLTPGGGIRYTLKTPYRDGTTHVLFEPLDFLARLAALVPLPRDSLDRMSLQQLPAHPVPGGAPPVPQVDRLTRERHDEQGEIGDPTQMPANHS